ncbi:helix-hairpin-helix domain-containing protein [Pseudomonas tussilaginis]|nr:helix-hairpin-helix domain-containing protein [Pseudomonas sp. S11A 273]
MDLNTADAPTLQSTLAGIGKTRSEAIVAYREEHRAFASVGE